MTRIPLSRVAAVFIGVAACTDPAVHTAGPERAEPLAAARAVGFYPSLPILGAAINDAGVVAGRVVLNGSDHAAVYRSGRIEILPGLGGTASAAAAINNAGDVAGYAETAAGEQRAVLWRNGEIHDLGTLGGDLSVATAVNNRGDVAGSSESAEGALLGFLWTRGRMIRVDPPPRHSGNTLNVVTGLNDRGEVIGWTSRRPGWGLERPFVWRNGTSIELDRFEESDGTDPFGRPGWDWFETFPDDINERGQIVGAGFASYSNYLRAVMWDHGEIMDLGSLVDCPITDHLCSVWSRASAINDRGQVVGDSRALDQPCTYCPFLWERGDMKQLFTADGSVIFGDALDINNAGIVLGSVWLWGNVSQRGMREGRGRATDLLPATRRGPVVQRPWAMAYCQARGRNPNSPLESIAACRGVR